MYSCAVLICAAFSLELHLRWVAISSATRGIACPHEPRASRREMSGRDALRARARACRALANRQDKAAQKTNALSQIASQAGALAVAAAVA
eukprot:6006196-Prymnesium_polylepis.1